jgi:hypothetical protein
MDAGNPHVPAGRTCAEEGGYEGKVRVGPIDRVDGAKGCC